MPLRNWLFGESTSAAIELKGATRAPAVGPAKVTRAGYEFGVPPSGLNEWNQSIGAVTGTDRRSMLNQLYETYLSCIWSWACVGAISKTITGGPLEFDWDADDHEGDQDQPPKPPNVEACERLFQFVNAREDIRQLMRSCIADLLVFGDCFIEVVWLAGVPAALYSLDCPSMMPIADQHGQITGYVQTTEFGQRAEFDPHEIIHISLDSPRSGLFGVSPTQASLLPITSWLFTEATLKEIFRKGNPPNLHVDLPGSYSEKETERWVHQHMTRNVGPRNIGYPVVTKNSGAVSELQPRKIQELLHTLDQRRDEILAGYGCPPAMVGVIESGNIGSGTGESQRKQFLINTCQPIAAILLEKLDYHLVKRGFGIEGWHLRFAEVDMRDSKTIEEIRDMRLRAGAWTLNRWRNDIGEPPVDGGDASVLVERQFVVVWRDMDAFSKSGVAKNLGDKSITMDEPGDEDTPLGLVRAEPTTPPPLPGVGGVPPGVGQPPPFDPNMEPADNTPAGESWQAYQRRFAQALAELPTLEEVA